MTKTINSDKGRKICSTGSEFIQERPGAIGSTNLPKFTAFSFTGVSGKTSAGATFDLTGATADYIADGSTQLCHTSDATSSSFKVNPN